MCVERTQNTIINFQDRGSKCKISFLNPKRREVQKIRVDNCLIKLGKRCDYLLVDHNNTEYYIELKGKDIDYACEQISETIIKITSDIRALKYSFVISTACPLATTTLQNYKIQFKKKFNSKLQIKNIFCEFCLS